MKRKFSFILAGFFCAFSIQGQTFFKSVPVYIEPSTRGDSGTEYSLWDVFYSPYNGVNYPDMEAPNGSGGFASESGFTPPGNASPGDPYAFWHLSNPTLTQTMEPDAFIIGAGTTGNIYSFSGPTAFEIADSTPYGVNSVTLQWQTDGQMIDFSTLRLVTSGNVEIAPTNFVTEYKTGTNPMGGIVNRVAAQWNLTGLGLTSYKLKFTTEDSSNSLQEVLLDTSANYVETTPSARVWNAVNGNWSNSANWSGGTVGPTGGNITLNSGTGVVVDGGTREIGELVWNAPGAFSIVSSAGGILKVNTGITANPASPSTYSITAPYQIGSYNLMEIGANANVTFASPVSGTTGFYKSGSGVLRLNANNTFTGSVTVDGGILEMGGSNTYSGPTAIFSGSMVLKGNAPSGSAGTMGSASTTVNLGSGGSVGTPVASLIVDGAFSVGRSISVLNGNDLKQIGARNTGTGAIFNGAVSLQSAATGLSVFAENVTDKLSFNGAISGGSAAGTITKTGSGRVVFGGSNKTYLSHTLVSSGTLEIATGTMLTGNGNMTLATGSELIANGTLNGSGSLVLNGGLLGGSGNINRAFTLDTGDILSPGNSPGMLSTHGQAWAGGGQIRFEINDASGIEGENWDYVDIEGALDLVATSVNKFWIKLASLNLSNEPGLAEGFDPNGIHAWKFATASSGITGFGSNDFQFDTSEFSNPINGTFSVSVAGNDLMLNYIPVPEPGTSVLLLAGVSILSRRRRLFKPTNRQS